mmetsp:Transcript_24475/g.58684  ORF Transcript_24475/g.58684 Transcript_24475/m.58684 type:complete len:236 (-) Transcript_24475:10-717(-)
MARDLPSTPPPTLLASRTTFSACRRVRSCAAPLAPTSRTSPHTTRHSSPSSSFCVSLARPSTLRIETSSKPTVTCAVPNASPFLGPSSRVSGSSSVEAVPCTQACRASASEQVALAIAITPSLAYCVPTGSLPSVIITRAPPSTSSLSRAVCKASRLAFMRPLLTPNVSVCFGLAGLNDVRGKVSLLCRASSLSLCCPRKLPVTLHPPPLISSARSSLLISSTRTQTLPSPSCFP